MNEINNTNLIDFEVNRLKLILTNKAMVSVDFLKSQGPIDNYATHLIETHKVKNFDSLIELSFNYEFKTRGLSEEMELTLAVLYWKYSEYYLSASDQKNSLRALLEAHRYLGRREVQNTLSAHIKKDIQIAKNRAKGGSSRKNKYDQIYSFFAELLESEKPSNGWKNKTTAINSLTLTLEKYIEKNHSKNGKPLMNLENLPTQMRGWFSRHPAVKLAYEKNCRKSTNKL